MTLVASRRVLALDPVTWDLIVPLRWLTGIDAVVQGVRYRLGLIRGEVFTNLSIGIPYLARDGVSESEALIGQKFDPDRHLAPFRDAILRTPDVIEIVLLEGVLDSERVLSIRWQARTAFGDTPVDVLATGEL